MAQSADARGRLELPCARRLVLSEVCLPIPPPARVQGGPRTRKTAALNRRPTSSTPVAESVDAARSKRVSICRFDSCREYHAPDRTVTVAASKTAIRGSIPRGCAMWEMPKWSRRRSAKPFLPGSSPGSHSIGGREATATLSGPENQRSGKGPDGVQLLRPPP